MTIALAKFWNCNEQQSNQIWGCKLSSTKTNYCWWAVSYEDCNWAATSIAMAIQTEVIMMVYWNNTEASELQINWNKGRMETLMQILVRIHNQMTVRWANMIQSFLPTMTQVLLVNQNSTNMIRMILCWKWKLACAEQNTKITFFLGFW